MYTLDTSHSFMPVNNMATTKTTPSCLSCTCSSTQYEYLAKLKPDIVYIQNGPLIPTPDLTIQIVDFTFMHDRFLDQAIQTKEDKYNPLVDTIRAQGWNITPLIVITAGVRGAVHTRSIELFENLHIPTSLIKKQ